MSSIHNDVSGLIKLFRFKKLQSLHDLTLAIKDVSDRKISDNMVYNSEDVLEILKDIEMEARRVVGAELMHHSHTTVLVARQYLSQGELSGVDLKLKLPELENRTLLDEIKNLEDSLFPAKK
ncbi:Leucine zipper transcription factor-like protein 1, partial [Nowakowskiella sp. JEL0078]